MSSRLELWYGPIRVGIINDAFISDDTWHGLFASDISADQGDLQQRLSGFIRFSEGWNERIGHAQPADTTEFDQYSDLLTSGLWRTRAPEGEVSPIDEAPAFFVGGGLSWRSG
jgi:hypothetical protein